MGVAQRKPNQSWTGHDRTTNLAAWVDPKCRAWWLVIDNHPCQIQVYPSITIFTMYHVYLFPIVSRILPSSIISSAISARIISCRISFCRFPQPRTWYHLPCICNILEPVMLHGVSHILACSPSTLHSICYTFGTSTYHFALYLLHVGFRVSFRVSLSLGFL